MFKRAYRLVVIIVIFAIVPNSFAAPLQQTNLLTNGDFENLNYNKVNTNIYEPYGWKMWWADASMPRMANQTDDWHMPEAWQYRDSERTSSFFPGTNGPIIFESTVYYKPSWWSLYQDVPGLTSGHEYKFSIDLYPMLLLDWNQNDFLGTYPNPAATEFRLKIEESGQVIKDTGFMPLAHNFDWKNYGITFVPSGASARVAIEFRSRFSINYNGATIDNAQLVATGNTGVASSASTATPVPAAATATATPVPAATAQPTAVPATQVPATGPTADWGAYHRQLTATAQAAQPQATPVPPTAVPQQVASVATSAPAQPQQPVRAVPTPFEVPPIEADGNMYYTVQEQDSLVRIASIACGETLDCLEKIKSRNNLSSNIIYVGQKLIVGPFEGSPTQPQAEPTATPEEAAAEPTPTATPEEVIEVAAATVAPEPTAAPVAAPAPALANVCVTLFEDLDGDAQRSASEPVLPDAPITLLDPAADVTIGKGFASRDATPTCFREILPGSYTVSVSLPDTHTATTREEWSVEITNSDNVDLTFGAQPAVAESGSAFPSIPLWLIALFGIGFVALLGLVVTAIVLRSRSKA